MLSLNEEIEPYACSLNEQDLSDIRDIMVIGKLAWSTKGKTTVEHPDVSVYRIYTTYTTGATTSINPSVKSTPFFLLQPQFYSCCASTGNEKITNIFDDLINQAIKLYNKTYTAVSCILSDHLISEHVHFVDPTKNVTTTTFYWTLTDTPINADFFIRDEVYPLHKAGKLEFDPVIPHGVDDRDGNMRFYVLFDDI